MGGKTSLVAFLGLSLVLANAWKTGVLSDLVNGNIDTGTSGQSWYQKPWGKVGYETIGVIVACFFADVSDGAADVFIAMFVAFWIVWIIVDLTGKHPPSVTPSEMTSYTGTSSTSKTTGPTTHVTPA